MSLCTVRWERWGRHCRACHLKLCNPIGGTARPPWIRKLLRGNPKDREKHNRKKNMTVWIRCNRKKHWCLPPSLPLVRPAKLVPLSCQRRDLGNPTGKDGLHVSKKYKPPRVIWFRIVGEKKRRYRKT